MTVIAVPYHLDEYLPDLDLPLEAAEVVTTEFPPGGPWERLAVLYDAVARAVAATVLANTGRSGGHPVVLTGDCLISLGIVAGLQHAGADPAIVWFDAHGDVQTPETTASGYLGGMPLRLLAGYRPELIAARLGLRPVPEHRIVLAGARDLDPPEATYLASAAIRRREVIGLTTADLPAGPLYVHVDLDVIDAAGLPGLRYPVPGGPDAARLADSLRTLLATGRVAALGVACTWRPGHASARYVAAQLSAVLEYPPSALPSRASPRASPRPAPGQRPASGPGYAAYVRTRRSAMAPCGPLASSPDRAGSSRCAATRQNSPAVPLMADSASGGPNRQISAPSGAVSSHRTGAACSPARLSAYGSVRCASQAMCLSRAVSGKSAPSGSAMSRPCAQCSASRVVASVAGLIVPTIHCTGVSGSAPRIAASEACRARRHRANTSAGPDGGTGRSARTAASARSSIVSPATASSAPRRLPCVAVAAAASSDWARCSTTSAIVQPCAPEADSHCPSSSPLRIFSSRSCSAARSSKMVIPAL